MVALIVGLTDQLIQPLVGNHAVTVGRDIRAMHGSWRFAIEQDFKTHWLTVFARPQHQM